MDRGMERYIHRGISKFSRQIGKLEEGLKGNKEGEARRVRGGKEYADREAKNVGDRNDRSDATGSAPP